LLSVFGALALLLCAMGVYGALAAMVEERRREIGIRRTLGASTREVVTLVAREALTMSVAGVGLGLLLAAGSAKLMEGLLFGVKPMDPAVFVAAGGFLWLIAAFAAAIPARRACDIDPAQALRDE
jgi:ABC-type antimicrobial peptide transport system permease subunit